MTPGAVRRDMRARRRGLPPAARADAALAIAATLLSSRTLGAARTIAAYVAADGEADPGPYVAAARGRGRRLHLPVLGPPGLDGLRFVRTEADQPLRPNRFGIPEPADGPTVDPRFLDLVLLPLVAFDAAGTRLGMGAGYYDRAFSFRRQRRHWRGPHLIGVAYSFQQVDALERKPWDVPLDGVVTEEALQFFTHTRTT